MNEYMGHWPQLKADGDWCCNCGFFVDGDIDALEEHLDEQEPKTAAEHFRELHAALVELRQAIIASLPNVIRKAFSKWDNERTP